MIKKTYHIFIIQSYSRVHGKNLRLLDSFIPVKAKFSKFKIQEVLERNKNTHVSVNLLKLIPTR
ncbi:hypothetical protein BpHYR1_047650 [Brachionus plicatilis]|uniref:Uncharacterized protein n=1 Tax=Brachionus plicatilis TaxID=10195 RepID=A0A3M7RXP3_BRAPC|nr:hypothetical protein BpHYR1_047650 [Brachionus plicatilis]